MSPSHTICRCKGVTVEEITGYVASHPEADADQVKEHCQVSQGCGNCDAEFYEFFHTIHPEKARKRHPSISLTKALRSLHLFVSLVAAVFLLFFAISGYAMNHREELGMNETVDSESIELLPDRLLEPSMKKALLAKMSDLGARGKLTEYVRDEESISITYQSAGRLFEAEIDLNEVSDLGTNTEIHISDSTFLETLGEIHRSESPEENDSSLFIDLMSLLMAAVSLTGIALFFRMASRKNVVSFACIFASFASAITIYYFLR